MTAENEALRRSGKSNGRRRCGEIKGYGIAASLGAAGLFFDQTLFGYPAFVVLLVPATLFFDGDFANIVPYSVGRSARGADHGRL